MDAPHAADSPSSSTPIVILMGVSGVGKTSVGVAVAKRLGWEFFDGDDFHPPANVDKMSRGIALDDEDRTGWLKALRQLIETSASQGRAAIIACSALKEKYRDFLRTAGNEVIFVYLKAAQEIVAERINDRGDHYFDPDLLESQYAALEEPDDAIRIDAAQPLRVVVEEIVRVLKEIAGAP